MKSINLKMAIIAIILGVSSAFAVKADAFKHNETTYYWYATSSDGVNYSWVSSPPSNTSCQPMTKPACEISTSVSGTPPANGFPSSYTVVESAAHAYQPD
jgi:hypothetical protein